MRRLLVLIGLFLTGCTTQAGVAAVPTSTAACSSCALATAPQASPCGVPASGLVVQGQPVAYVQAQARIGPAENARALLTVPGTVLECATTAVSEVLATGAKFVHCALPSLVPQPVPTVTLVPAAAPAPFVAPSAAPCPSAMPMAVPAGQRAGGAWVLNPATGAWVYYPPAPPPEPVAAISPEPVVEVNYDEPPGGRCVGENCGVPLAYASK